MKKTAIYSLLIFWMLLSCAARTRQRKLQIVQPLYSATDAIYVSDMILCDGYRHDKRSRNKSYHDSGEHWSKELAYLPADTLSIFILDAKLYRDSSLSYIRDNYQMLQRYDLSLDNLKQLDFKVPYPPTAEMSGMKMYP